MFEWRNSSKKATVKIEHETGIRMCYFIREIQEVVIIKGKTWRWPYIKLKKSVKLCTRYWLLQIINGQYYKRKVKTFKLITKSQHYSNIIEER